MSWQRLWDWAEALEDGRPVLAFRVFFGLSFSAHALHLLAKGDVVTLFDEAAVRLPHWGLPPTLPLPLSPARLPSFVSLHAILAVLGVCIAIGLFTRRSALLALVLFSVPVFADASAFFNHWYLQWLLLLLFSVMPCGQHYSVDAWLCARPPPRNPHLLPRWCRLSLCCAMYGVYEFAALAKLGLGTDWVNGRALQLWMFERTPDSAGWLGAPLVRALRHQWCAAIGAMGAVALQLLAPAMSISLGAGAHTSTGTGTVTGTGCCAGARRARNLACVAGAVKYGTYLGLVGFHVSNGLLFEIGVFPALSVALTTLCVCSPETSPCALENAILAPGDTGKSCRPAAATVATVTAVGATGAAGATRRRAPRLLLLVVALSQLWLPLRHVVLPGWYPHAAWAELAYPFSWRMFGSHKQPVELRILAYPWPHAPSGGMASCAEDITAAVLSPLTLRQRARVATDPQLLVSALRLAMGAAKSGLTTVGAGGACSGRLVPSSRLGALVPPWPPCFQLDDVRLYAAMRVEFNGRAPQHVLNPWVDVAPFVHGPHLEAWVPAPCGAIAATDSNTGGGGRSSSRSSGGWWAGAKLQELWEVPPWLKGAARGQSASAQRTALRDAAISSERSLPLPPTCCQRTTTGIPDAMTVSDLIRRGWHGACPRVPIDTDCVVSRWSDWFRCGGSNGRGRKRRCRTRKILVPPAGHSALQCPFLRQERISP